MSEEAVDLSERLGPVRDQGNRGTCLAFAVTAAHELARQERRGGDREALSEELLYWACKQIDGDTAPGTSGASATRALRDTGQPPAERWPYDGDRDDADPAYQPPPAALERNALRCGSVKKISVDVGAVRDALRTGRAIVVAFELWDAFYDAGVDVLAAPDVNELLGDGHAVVVVGFDMAEDTLLLRNSWDADWGENGHARVAAAALGVTCFGAWVVEDDLDP